jgi:biotin synthase
MTQLRHDWTTDDVLAVLESPFHDLLHRAHGTHRENFDPAVVEGARLLSIKTGGCPEDCAYCPQSAHHEASVQLEALLATDDIVAAAREARAEGATRFCMGAAWRSPSDRQVDRVAGAISAVAELGMETCVTLGMLTDPQAETLAEAGLDYYNHNLDTSPDFYGQIITTRTYEDRLETLESCRRAGLALCTGGIVGMGETRRDRAGLLAQLASLNPHPESVPVNLLVRAPGTPLADVEPLDGLEVVRTIATARLTMPHSVVRLSAGRSEMSAEMQALCLHAGANSIFVGDRLLTTPNPGDGDAELLARLDSSLATEPVLDR